MSLKQSVDGSPAENLPCYAGPISQKEAPLEGKRQFQAFDRAER